MSLRLRSVVAVATLATGSVVLGGAPAHASGPPTWRAALGAPIHPGSETITAGGQCTANFVFYDNNHDIYIGQSAHCASLGGPTDTNGCTTGSQPLGTNVTVEGATKPGKLVYSSWLAMQAKVPPIPTNSPECLYNDFALIKLDAADYGRVNPSIPFWGGPVAVNTSGSPSFRDVFSYGNSSLRLGLAPLSPKRGVTSNTTNSASWQVRVYTASPGIPGDSGSAFLDENGQALGTLSTLYSDGSNGVATIYRELDYLRANSSFTSLTLALGTEAFNPRV